MFLIRDVNLEDADDLFSLSKESTLLNLPRNKDKIKSKITQSINSFKNPTKNLSENEFIFVLEDINKKKVIGASMIHGQHGTIERPHFYLTVGEEKKYSSTLKKELTHGTLKFGYEVNGYTEIGGLILSSDYRKSPYKLGKQLSMARFLFMAKHPELFTEKIHSELLPPFNPDGKSLLWEALGRKVLNMDYWDADLLSQENKEFILNLFPSGTIYTNLLPESATETIGKVGESTRPVKKMLEDIGFIYTREIDPFDGGPHYRANLTDIKPIKGLIKGKLIKSNNSIQKKSKLNLLVSVATPPGEFKAFLLQNFSTNEKNDFFTNSNLDGIIDAKEDILNIKGFYI